MTEKTLKISKNKKKLIKLKKQQKQTEPDSDISDLETLGNTKKIDKKELKQISTEVTDLLASLKKQHGIEDESIDVAPKNKEKQGEKASKNKKEAKNATKDVAKKVAQQLEKKLPVQKLQQQQQQKGKANGHKKQKQAKSSNTGEKLGVKINQAEENSPMEKTNKKRAAADIELKSEQKNEPKPKKTKKNPTLKQPGNKKLKQEAVEPIVKKEKESQENDTDDAENDAATLKKEHHLKNAVPVFVGNLPVNIKRIKLVKTFKKFGKILSIRIRTNTGKSFLRKAQLNKVPSLIAFIYFETPQAAKASTVLSGEKIGDNTIVVDLDTKEKSINIKPQNTVVIGNLKYAVTENILRESFKCCGEIEHIRVVQSTLGCKGVAFIRFVNPESCALALKLNGTPILEREVRVEKYKTNMANNEKNVKKEKTVKPIQKKKNAMKQKQMANNPSSPEKKKKKKNKEFLGVKSNDVKKDKVKKKKKKKFSQEKRLALKVAPKTEKASD